MEQDRHAEGALRLFGGYHVTPCFARTAKPLYLDMARFWTRVFGLIFAIGVVTGIPMEFQFGTNWARSARFVGDVACRGERSYGTSVLAKRITDVCDVSPRIL